MKPLIKKIGNKAENQALKYLKKHGLRLVKKNYLTKIGEIDIIMLDNDTLVFIEVRYRTNNYYGDAITSVNYNKQKKIIRTAKVFLQQYPKYEDFICRFDVIGVESSLKYAKLPIFVKIKKLFKKDYNNIDWIKNAFEL